MAYQDKFVQVDGLKTRYIEDGSGPAVICLHGASLGSSADVFERATIMKEKFPQLDLHIVDNCKHLVQWDVMDQFHQMATKFLPN
jgi:pimeloyl-ACP methyl ester carboxylesterase